MWINPEVDLPEQLISAQRDGNLVIFAGAGVSMGAPSNLPDFWEFARQLAGASMRAPARDEPLDRYLGVVENLGVNIQTRAREILDHPASNPTTLHRELFALFRSAEDARLITTNFDRHFTTTGKDRFGDRLDIYYGPALPLGRAFSGLVYLHGAVERPKQHLVLTDRDFGRAYLTDGWATRMLMETFARYTVLFVGYSHNDPVMTYLARGLVPGTLRFALTQPGYQDWWSHLGITAVPFPLRPEPDAYGALPAAVSSWVEQANLGTLGHADRIRELVQAPPPLEADAAGYLETTLRDPVAIRFFTAHARSPEWLRWVEEKGAFAPLFTDAGCDGVAEEIAQWFAEHFAVEHAKLALELVARQGLTLNWVLWNAIGRELALREERPDPTVLSAWTAILVRSARPGWARAYLGHLLQACRYPEDRVAAVILFRHMTRPLLALDRPLGLADAEKGPLRLEAEIVIDGEPYYLSEAWKLIFLPHMNELVGELAPLLSSHLREAHSILQSTGAATGAWDPLSFQRSAIEPHEQDRFEATTDVLIDCARDVIDWMVQHEPDRGDALVREWSRSGIPLLKRLALHGMGESDHLDPNRVLDSIIQDKFLYSLGVKHELFRLIAKAYSHASKEARGRFIAHASTELVDAGIATGNDARQIRDYERYNMAVWLTQSDPACPLASEYLAEMQAAYPQFSAREHPDLTHWMGEFEHVTPESPVTAEKLITGTPAEWVDFLSTYQEGDRGSGPSREGLLIEIASSVRQSARWGLDLAAALETRDCWQADLWSVVIGGWATSQMTADEWQELLLLIERIPTLDSLGRNVMSLLRHGLESDAIPPSALDSVDRLTDLAYALPDDDGEVLRPGPFDDWLSAAINHIAGEAVQNWCLTISYRRSIEGDTWRGIPTSYQTRLNAVLVGESVHAQLGRAIIARYTAFFFNIDQVWTKAELLPRFDWEKDPAKAQQVWHGHLHGSWSDALFAEMVPVYRQSFARLDAADLKTLRSAFCNRLAATALRSSVHPWDSGWLSDFVRDAGGEARAAWTEAVGDALGQLKPEAKKAAWERWIWRYWTERLTGVPRPLSAEEKQGMVTWAKRLGPVFPNAVELVRATPVSLEKTRLIFYDFQTSDLVTLYPTPTAHLIEHIITHISELPYECGFVDKAVRRLLEAGADKAILLSICEQMARLGCRSAVELRTLVSVSGLST
jgi:hypothetical protein